MPSPLGEKRWIVSAAADRALLVCARTVASRCAENFARTERHTRCAACAAFAAFAPCGAVGYLQCVEISSTVVR